MGQLRIKGRESSSGFTIVELLIVIVVIGILAAVTVVAFSNAQTRAKNSSTQASLKQVQKLVEMYAVENGSYPTTGSLSNVYTDSNCSLPVDSDGQESANWIPGLSGGALPQGNFNGSGRQGLGGCFAYASNGTDYIITAWNTKFGNASTDAMYKRLGFRETSFFSANGYLCNHNGNIGGIPSGTYSADFDYYKFSYTLTNISNCNETPPAGA